MAKAKTRFVCSECGYESGKWMGRCPNCQNWNCLIEEVIQPQRPQNAPVSFSAGTSPIHLKDVETAEILRTACGIPELERVLGGGIVPASVVLCAGDPGIGKSTLLLQMALNCARMNVKTLYISAEESAKHVRLRADRLGEINGELYILAQTELNDIINHIQLLKPEIVICDSIQTVYAPEISSAPGSVSQVRECAGRLMRLAKEEGCSIFIVGHVTKEGSIAGPKVLEHIVDTVLYFEGERSTTFRILRAAKNRFGSTNEIGVFEMSSSGMEEVANPSEMFLSQSLRSEPGSAVYCAMEGSRPVLCEIQALCSTAVAPMPRRTATGVDYNRLSMLLAVLEKKLGFKLYGQDVFVNVAGGFKIDEPGADLALVCALVSSLRAQTIDRDTVLIGEIGLTGELRAVTGALKRISECEKLGFKRVILPQGNKKGLEQAGIRLDFAQTLKGALKLCFEESRV